MSFLDDPLFGLLSRQELEQRRARRLARQRERALAASDRADNLSGEFPFAPRPGPPSSPEEFYLFLRGLDKSFAFPPELAELRERLELKRARAKVARLAVAAARSPSPFIQEAAAERFFEERAKLSARERKKRAAEARKRAKAVEKARKEAFKSSLRVQRGIARGLAAAGRHARPAVEAAPSAVAGAFSSAARASASAARTGAGFLGRLASRLGGERARRETLFASRVGDEAPRNGLLGGVVSRFMEWRDKRRRLFGERDKDAPLFASRP